MQDEPEVKEKDPVSAIRKALKIALDKLKKLGGEEEEELQEEMDEVKEAPSTGTASGQSANTGNAIKFEKSDEAKTTPR